MPVDSTGINTAILVSSSFTMHWALVSVKREQPPRADPRAALHADHGPDVPRRCRSASTTCCTSRASRPSTGRSRASFFGLTGLHGIHVFVGAILLAIALVRTLRGHYSPEKHMGVELTGIYWHFVDVVWVVLYTLVYLLSNGARAPL